MEPCFHSFMVPLWLAHEFSACLSHHHAAAANIMHLNHLLALIPICSHGNSASFMSVSLTVGALWRTLISLVTSSGINSTALPSISAVSCTCPVPNLCLPFPPAPCFLLASLVGQVICVVHLHQSLTSKRIFTSRNFQQLFL